MFKIVVIFLLISLNVTVLWVTESTQENHLQNGVHQSELSHEYRPFLLVHTTHVFVGKNENSFLISRTTPLITLRPALCLIELSTSMFCGVGTVYYLV